MSHGWESSRCGEGIEETCVSAQRERSAQCPTCIRTIRRWFRVGKEILCALDKVPLAHRGEWVREGGRGRFGAYGSIMVGTAIRYNNNQSNEPTMPCFHFYDSRLAD
jgi:hypothetical protein